MSKLIAMLIVAAAAVACTKKEEAPAAAPAAPAEVSAPAAPAEASAPAAPAAPATPAAPAADAAPAAAPAAAAGSTPKECQDYLDQAAACAAKLGGAAGDAMKASLEQTKSAWSAMGGDPTSLAKACKQAGEAFTAQASQMKC